MFAEYLTKIKKILKQQQKQKQQQQQQQQQQQIAILVFYSPKRWGSAVLFTIQT